MDRLVSRRQVLAGAVGASALSALPATRAAASAGVVRPARFPAGVPLLRRTFQNWSQAITAPDLLTAIPRESGDFVALANWARRADYRVRATGASHGWSPLVITGDHPPRSELIVDTTRGLGGIHVHRDATPTVTVGAGVLMQDLLAALEAHGFGLTGVPAPGDVSVGGVLAIDGHGATTPASGERHSMGSTFGSVSNLIHSLDAVVWNERRDRYEERTFVRDDPEMRALSVHLGRSMITRARLHVTRNTRLHCQSYTDITAEELFAPPGVGGRTFSHFLDRSGRAEIILFPFADKPWFKTWTVAPHQPAGSVETKRPFNYAFSDSIPVVVSQLARRIVSGDTSITPTFGALLYDVSVAGLAATNTTDLWGWSKNLQLYIKPSTLRVTANGYAVHCRREDVQRVLADLYRKYSQLLHRYRRAGKFPVNGPLEIRTSGLDHAADVGAPASATPTLSALHPHPHHPEWDTAVWIDALTLPGTPDADAFFSDLEAWMFRHFRGTTMIRPEWSKGWAYTTRGAWTNSDLTRTAIPASHTVARSAGHRFADAARQLHKLDPAAVFTNGFLTNFLRP